MAEPSVAESAKLHVQFRAPVSGPYPAGILRRHRGVNANS